MVTGYTLLELVTPLRDQLAGTLLVIGSGTSNSNEPSSPGKLGLARGFEKQHRLGQHSRRQADDRTKLNWDKLSSLLSL